jgi:hypothetical protein
METAAKAACYAPGGLVTLALHTVKSAHLQSVPDSAAMLCGATYWSSVRLNASLTASGTSVKLTYWPEMKSCTCSRQNKAAAQAVVKGRLSQGVES